VQLHGSTAAQQTSSQVRYTYDYQDRQIRRALDSDGNGVVDEYRYTAYDGENPFLEFLDDDGLNEIGWTSVSNRYLYGPAVDQILAVEDDSDVIRWGLSDHQGTIRDVVNNSGDVVRHVQFDTFGNVLSPTSVSASFPFGHHGEKLDPATGLYRFGLRWYDPAAGRWLSEDSISLASGDPNFYRYCQNNAIIYTDPSGLCSTGLFNTLGKIGSSIYSGISSYATNYFSSTLGMMGGIVGLGAAFAVGGQPVYGPPSPDYDTTPPEPEVSPAMRELLVPTPPSNSVRTGRNVLRSDESVEFVVGPEPALPRNGATPIAESGPHAATPSHSPAPYNGPIETDLPPSLQAGITFGAGFIPGVGETMDIYTLFASDSTWLDRGLSVASLGVNFFTAGFAPNFGGVAKAGRILRASEEVVEETAKNAKTVISVGKQLSHSSNSQGGPGSYTNTHQSGKTYSGKGSEERMNKSSRRIEKEYNDPVIHQEHTPAANTKQSFIDEQNRIDTTGGPGGNTYNKRNSPGKKLRDGS
jgi:RHS repeat-associated protein